MLGLSGELADRPALLNHVRKPAKSDETLKKIRFMNMSPWNRKGETEALHHRDEGLKQTTGRPLEKNPCKYQHHTDGQVFHNCLSTGIAPLP